jgi:transposase
MKGVDTIARVRREYLVRGRSIREIALELNISRNTVRKILRSGETAFVYERTVQPQPKLGSWRAELDRLLAANAARSSRERLTLIRIFEELRGLGYAGGYDAVRRYAASWRREQSAATAAAFVPLSFAPGEAYQFDWSHEIVLIAGTTVTVKVAHVRLCHSRMLFVRAYPRETQEMVFDAHDRAFAFFKGACTRGIYDSETLFAIGSRTMVARRPPWMRSWSARSALITAASSRCAGTIWSSRSPARRPPAGRRGRSRTRSALCGSGFSRRGSG